MKAKKIFLFFVIIRLVILAPIFFTQAAGPKMQEVIYIGKEEVLTGNLYKAGATVEVAGTIDGDVFVVGASVIISGKVTGDVFAAGSSVKVSGEVEGNIRAVGSTLDISGLVGKNILAGAGTLTLEEKSEITGSVTAGAGALDLRGKIGKEVLVGGGSLILAGEFSGPVNAYLGNAQESGKLVVYPNAELASDLTYTAQDQADIKDGAVIKGNVTHNLPQIKPVINKEKVKKVITTAWVMSRVFNFFALLVVGLILVSFIPKVVGKVGDQMITNIWANIGRGLLFFIVVPVIALALIFTLIGLPVALIMIATYLISLYLAKVFVGISLGYALLKALGRKDPQMMVSMIIGVLVLVIITSLPFIGWLISLVLTWWALGALVVFNKEELAKWK